MIFEYCDENGHICEVEDCDVLEDKTEITVNLYDVAELEIPVGDLDFNNLEDIGDQPIIITIPSSLPPSISEKDSSECDFELRFDEEQDENTDTTNCNKVSKLM